MRAISGGPEPESGENKRCVGSHPRGPKGGQIPRRPQRPQLVQGVRGVYGRTPSLDRTRIRRRGGPQSVFAIYGQQKRDRCG